jgi:hypothetical protein
MNKMSFLRKLFGTRKKNDQPIDVDLDLNENEKHLIREFSHLSIDDRLRRIIILGDSGEPGCFKLLQYGIQYDPDLHVKFAALKRIHLFKGHPDLEPMLNLLKENKTSDKLEPYFSMALSRMGLITIEEFERKINSAS